MKNQIQEEVISRSEYEVEIKTKTGIYTTSTFAESKKEVREFYNSMKKEPLKILKIRKK